MEKQNLKQQKLAFTNQNKCTTGTTQTTTTTTTILRPFFRDHPGEPVPEGNFWNFWCKGRLTEADTDHLAGRSTIPTKYHTYHKK